MLLNDVYNEISAYFKSNSVEDYSTEARILISFILDLTTSNFQLKKNTHIVSQREYSKIYNLSKKRVNGKSIASIIGKKEFYGEDFFVNDNTLIPRPETEMIIDIILEKIENKSKLLILDIGTGSGIIPITLSRFYIYSKFHAIDISKKALYVARKNRVLHKIDNSKIKFINADFFNFKPKRKYNIIVSNPPYIKSIETDYLLKNKVISDPKVSLDGGKDGLSFYREIKTFSDKYLENNGTLFLEHGINQRDKITDIFKENYTLECFNDYSGIDRIITASKKKKL